MIHVYRIGVHMAMQGNATQAVATLMGHMAGLQRHVHGTQMGFNAMSVAIAAAGAAFAGSGLLMGMNSLAQAGERYLHQVVQLREAWRNMPDREGLIGRAEAIAVRTSGDVMSSTASENLRSIRELTEVFGSPERAMQNLAMFQRAQAVALSTLGPEAGGRVGRSVWEMGRVTELRGTAMNPAEAEMDVDAMTRASISTGGRITGAHFAQALTYMRGSYLGMSREFLFEILPSLITDLGNSGSAAGTSLATLNRAIIGGTMTERAKGMFRDAGLLDMSRVTMERGRMVLAPGAVRGSAQYTENPLLWMQNVLLPALARRDRTTPEALLANEGRLRELIGPMFSDRNAAQAALFLLTKGSRDPNNPAAQILKDQENTRAAAGLDAYQRLSTTDPVLANRAVTAQWEFATEMIGKAIAPDRVRLMMMFARALNAIGQWANEHPELVRLILLVALALGAFAVVIGTLAIAFAAISVVGVPLVIGMGAVAVAIVAVATALLTFDWPAIGTFFRTWGETLWGVIMSAGQGIGNAFAGAWRFFYDGMGAAIAWMMRNGAAFRDWVFSIWPGLEPVWGRFLAAGAQLVTDIANWLASLPSQIGAALRAIVPGVVQDVPGIGPRAPNVDPGRTGAQPIPGFNDPDADEAGMPRPPGFVPPPPRPRADATPIIIQLDGREMASAMIPHVGRELSGPRQGPARLDSRRAIA